MHLVHVPVIPPPILTGALVVVMDHLVIFRVDEKHPPGRRHALHDRAQSPEIGLAVLHLWTGRPDTGREDLEAGDSRLHQLRDLAYRFLVGSVAEDRVVGVVGIAVPLPPLFSLLDGMQQVMARYLGCEVEHRRGAAENRRLRDRLSA